MATVLHADSVAILMQLSSEWERMNGPQMHRFLIHCAEILTPEQISNILLHGFRQSYLSREDLVNLLSFILRTNTNGIPNNTSHATVTKIPKSTEKTNKIHTVPLSNGHHKKQLDPTDDTEPPIPDIDVPNEGDSDPERTVSLSPIPLTPAPGKSPSPQHPHSSHKLPPDHDDNTEQSQLNPSPSSTVVTSSSIMDIPFEFMFRIFSYLEMVELLTVELCCTKFRIISHHPLSFHNECTLTLLQSHYQYPTLYRFKHCKSISFQEISKSMMAERGVSDPIDTFSKDEKPFFQHRYADRHEQWRSICSVIQHDFQNIESITIPVNFGAIDVIVDEILVKIPRLKQLVIEGQCGMLEGDHILELDDDYNLDQSTFIKRFGLFSNAFDYDLARGLLRCPQIDELVINHVLLELNSFTMTALTTTQTANGLNSKYRVDTLVLNGCHLGTHKRGDLDKYFQFNPSAKNQSEDEPQDDGDNKLNQSIRLKATGDVLCDGLWTRNVLIRNHVPYIERCPFTMNHPVVLPLQHCNTLMLNWAVIENEDDTKQYQLEKEIRLSDLSKVKEFSIKFHNKMAMNAFMTSKERMRIGRNVDKLCLCINDYHKSFEHNLDDGVEVITLFVRSLFAGRELVQNGLNGVGKQEEEESNCNGNLVRNNGMKIFQIEFRRACWALVDAAMKMIIEECGSMVKHFYVSLFEPRSGKFRGRKKDKMEWEYKNRLHTTANLLDEVMNYLGDADSVYVKLSYVEEFAEDEMREFERDFECDVEEVDEGEFIYEFKRHKKSAIGGHRGRHNDLSFAFGLDDFEYERL